MPKLRVGFEKIPKVLAVRQLTEADVAEMVAEPVRQSQQIAKIRHSHHRVARLLALGLPRREVAELTGYSESRVSQLQQSPAFEELIAQYRKEDLAADREKFGAYPQMVMHNALAAERMIADELEEREESGNRPPLRDLVSISRDAADRLGYGKRSTQVNLNVDFAAQLDRAIKRSAQAAERVIDHTDGKVVMPATLMERTGGQLPQPVAGPNPLWDTALDAPKLRRRA